MGQHPYGWWNAEPRTNSNCSRHGQSQVCRYGEVHPAVVGDHCHNGRSGGWCNGRRCGSQCHGGQCPSCCSGGWYLTLIASVLLRLPNTGTRRRTSMWASGSLSLKIIFVLLPMRMGIRLASSYSKGGPRSLWTVCMRRTRQLTHVLSPLTLASFSVRRLRQTTNSKN